MRILLSGYAGFMGREVVRLCDGGYGEAHVVLGVDPSGAEGAPVPVVPSFDAVPYDMDIDCIVDFSHHTATEGLLALATARSVPVVIATTGHTPEELAAIRRAAERIPVFFSANMSLGVALLVDLAKRAAVAMQGAEIEIVEIHHDRKVDAPSGTARMLADAIREVRPETYPHEGRTGYGRREAGEIGIHSLRMGNVVGVHEVILATQSQTVTLKHEAHSRALFAEGALVAAAYIFRAERGLHDMKSLIESR